MQSEWEKGASYMRDNVIAHIIAMQSDLGDDIEMECLKQKVLEHI